VLALSEQPASAAAPRPASTNRRDRQAPHIRG
jgi:hypothetical protein